MSTFSDYPCPGCPEDDDDPHWFRVYYEGGGWEFDCDTTCPRCGHLATAGEVAQWADDSWDIGGDA